MLLRQRHVAKGPVVGASSPLARGAGRTRPGVSVPATAVAQLAPTATTAAELVQARCRHLTAPTCHSSHGKGITVYLAESEAHRPTLLLSVKQDRHTGLYFLL